jgi:hypothetical protein
MQCVCVVMPTFTLVLGNGWTRGECRDRRRGARGYQGGGGTWVDQVCSVVRRGASWGRTGLGIINSNGVMIFHRRQILLGI